MNTDQPPRIIHLDVETKSRESLKKLGAWGYAQAPSTDLWCVCWREEGSTEEVRVWVPGDPVPDDFDPARPWTMAAHNYRFEQAIWQNIAGPRYGFPQPVGYACTMAMAMANNLPASLEGLAMRLGVEEQKDTVASRIMVKMSNKKTYDPEKEGSTAAKNHADNIKILIAYCQQDVRTEEAAYHAMAGMQFNSAEFEIDRLINDRGIHVDTVTAKAIDQAVAAEVKSANARIKEITNGEVATGKQVAKMLTWLRERGFTGDGLAVGVIKQVLEDPGALTPDALAIIRLRQQLALGSVAKYDVMCRVADEDGRMHGLFQLYGASMTGRWAGRLVQFQNLPRMSLRDYEIDFLCRMFRAKNIDTIKMFGYDVIAVAKQLIRPMFTAQDDDHQLIVSDFAQIECRVEAWLAGCPKLLELFSSKDRDPYAEMAADIYKQPVEKCGKGTEARQLGKTAILGCFAADTPVLTDKRGWVPITEVLLSDRLWDGVEWVQHEGVIDQGLRETIDLNGLSVTPDHEILTPNGWKTACLLNENTSLLQASIEFASSPLWPYSESKTTLIRKSSPGPVRTFDIHNAGPRARFTVLSDTGPLIVSNCGYGMGKAKFKESVKSMVGLDISAAVASQAVDTYRGTFPEVPSFWKAMERAVLKCLRPEGGIVQVGYLYVGRSHDSTTVAIKLPSGRCLFYPNLHLGSEGDIRFSEAKGAIGYTYGGKLCENVTQAVARDVLMEAMFRMEAAGQPVVGHVHDEVILEVPRGSVTIDEIDAIMTERPQWGLTIPLAVESAACDRYTK